MKPPLFLLKPIIGKRIEIIKSSDRNLVGLSGRVVFESRNMIGVLVNERIIFIPKSTCIFKLYMDEKKIVIVDGKILVNRFMKLRKLGRRRKRVGKRKNNVVP